MNFEEMLKAAKERRNTIKTKIDDLTGKLVDAENKPRDMTDEERKAFDDLLAADDVASGDCERFKKLIDQRASAEKPERRTAPETPGREQGAHREDRTRVRVLPRSGKLRSFRGANAEEDAYQSGQWALATIGGDARAAEWCREHGIETRTAVTTSNTLGGYLVPAPMEMAIINLREERGVFRQESFVRSMTSDTLIVPRRAGGVTAYFVNEGSEVTASDKGWDAVSLTARKIAALCKYSTEINEDSAISIADDLAQEIAYAFADKEDECGFNGDGTSTYGGIVGVKNAVLAGSKYTAIAGNTAFGTLDLEDFEAMVGKLPQYAVANAKWYISRVGWANSMLRLAAAAGGNTVSNIEQGASPQFLGFPVKISQVLNSTSTAQTSTDGICYLGDLRLATSFGNRRGMSISVDSSRYFELDLLAIKGTQRFDINVHEKGTATVAGPVIMMSTPGS